MEDLKSLAAGLGMLIVPLSVLIIVIMLCTR